MEFDLEDIIPAQQVQVVGGMHFDRRVFLVVGTGRKRPTVIALTPHMAGMVARDLLNPSTTGEVHDAGTPVVAPVVVRPVLERRTRPRREGDDLP